MRLMTTNRLFLMLLLVTLFLPPALAQNFSSDARRIALGGAGDADNIASTLVAEQQSYRVIPIPIGLFQVYKNRRFFNPDDDEFDPVRAIEYAADPMHITLRRNSASAGNRLVQNLMDAQLNRDLNTYRGFKPDPEMKAQGLIAPSWGKTFNVTGDSSTGRFHGVYVGAGPYLSVGTNLAFDRNLIEIFSASANVYKTNTRFLVGDNTTGQAAVAITGGYRGRFALPGSTSGSDREGLYIATNYSYLRGLHYERGDLELRFDTDSTGLVTLAPTTTPLVVSRSKSDSGNGFSIDIATAIVTEHWDLSAGIDGIANRITWDELTGRQYVLQSLFSGGDFISSQIPVSDTTRRVSLPVRYSGAAAYHTGRWSAASELGRGLQGFHFNAGAEYLFGPLAFRGGTRLSRDVWHPAAGIGFNLIPRFGIDVAAFQNSTNIESNRRYSFAVSLRLNRI
jgi:hypothetical protein